MSPYEKYNKTPHRYSGDYYAWKARIMRKKERVYDGKIASLRRGKDDVREVATGYECGIILEDFTDFEVGDVIEAYNQERVKPGA